VIAETADRGTVDALSRSLIPAVPINAADTLVALWSADTALALLAAFAVFYALGSTLLQRGGEPFSRRGGHRAAPSPAAVV